MEARGRVEYNTDPRECCKRLRMIFEQDLLAGTSSLQHTAPKIKDKLTIAAFLFVHIFNRLRIRYEGMSATLAVMSRTIAGHVSNST